MVTIQPIKHYQKTLQFNAILLYDLAKSTTEDSDDEFLSKYY